MPRSFESLGLIEPLLHAINDLGYEEPTPIQDQTISLLLDGQDVIAQARTGTGKTAAFALPMLQTLDLGSRRTQALILAPTRELAIQVAEMTHALGRHLHASILAVYGGQPIDRQLRALRQGVQIVVGTPGRIMDHIRRETLDLSGVDLCVLDEADQMLDMGFLEDVEFILSHLPAERQTCLFSATFPKPILELARSTMRDPKQITIAREKLAVPKTVQMAYEVAQRTKLGALTRILDAERPEATIVFTRTRQDSQELGEELAVLGYQAESLHGDLNQTQRDRVMRRFREGQVEVLVATDVAARGLDITGVSHVVHYDVPGDVDSYIHRTGRTGRAGKEGCAITLVTPRERRNFLTIERLLGKKIPFKPLPTLADVAERRLGALRERVLATLTEGDLDHYVSLVEDLGEDYDTVEVAAAALKTLADSERPRTEERPQIEDDGVTAEAGMTRLFITVGREAGLRPQDVVGAIANEAGVPGRNIGSIEIYPSCSFVDVPEDSAQAVLAALNKTTLKGRKVHADIAWPKGKTGPRGGAKPRSPRKKYPE
ncbi:MAG TPA: DEAD/DEAH box helicase [Armatimonadota bacterium]|jgi:ATP-dependent RNA helicase DeaD